MVCTAGVCAYGWRALMRRCGGNPPTKDNKVPSNLDLKVVLDDPLTMERIASRLVGMRRGILATADSDLPLPEAIGDIYCPLCWAACYSLMPTKTMLAFLASIEANFPKGPVWGVQQHQPCPFSASNWESGVLVAYLIRKYTHDLVDSVLVPVDTSADGDRQRVPLLEGGDKATSSSRSKGRVKRKKRNSDELRDFLAGLPTAQDRVEALQERYEQKLDELAMVQNFGDSDISWADAMQERDLENDLRRISMLLANHRERATRESGGDDRDYVGARAQRVQEITLRKEAHVAMTQHEEFALAMLQKAAVKAQKLQMRAWAELTERTAQTSLVAEEQVEWKTLMKAAKRDRLESGQRELQRIMQEEDAEATPPPVCENAKSLILLDDDRFIPVDEREMEGKIRDLLKVSERTIARHREVGALMTAHCAEYEPSLEVAQKSVLRSRKKGPPTALESEITGSKKACYGAASAVLFHKNQIRGATALPIGDVKMGNLGTLLITHRHYNDNEDVPIYVGQVVSYIAYPNPRGVPHEGQVISIVCPPGQDVQYLWTTAKPVGLSKFGFTADPRVGDPIFMVTATAIRTLKDGVREVDWESTLGKVVAANARHIHYDVTTVNGDCGFPVYIKGNIASIHTLGGSTYDGAKRANAGERVEYLPPPKKGTSSVPHFDPNPAFCQSMPRLEGRTVGPGLIDAAFDANRRRNLEKVSYSGLRQDINLLGAMPVHHWAKPSTKDNHREIAKYFDEIEYDLDEELLKKAITAAVLYDSDSPCEIPFAPPTPDSILRIFSKMDKQKSAGPVCPGSDANAYVAYLGGGDSQVGLDRLVDRVMRMYRAIVDDDVKVVDDDLVAEMMNWGIIGKRDGYKEKKLPIHDPPGSFRTIQAPSLEMKILWLVCFGENDDLWVHREGWVHAGVNDDLPCSWQFKNMVLHAKGAIACDLTAFDRYMPAEMISPFFLVYMAYLNPGVPDPLLRFLAIMTVRGPLIMSDGTVYYRSRGNPSGFMNTLRLNCFVHLVCLAYVVMRRRGDDDPLRTFEFLKNDLHVQMCGDDSRHFALTDEGAEVLDLAHDGAAYLQVWAEELPWEVKLEGMAVYQPTDDLATRAFKTPPMVSRRLLVMDGLLFEPLTNVSRCLKRLMCCERREHEVEFALVSSAYSSLCLHVYWFHRGLLRCPPLEMLLREFHGWVDMSWVFALASDYYRQGCRQDEPVPPRAPARLFS